jgi:vacuolar protein sorting-associated protein 3
LDWCGHDRRIYQSQRRPGARHVAVVESPTFRLFVLSLSPHHFAAHCVTALEYPYVTALLPDQAIEVHNVESQEIVQTVPAPPLPSPNETSLMALLAAERRGLAMSSNGCFVPSQQQSEKLTLKKVNLLSRNAKPGGREIVSTSPPVVAEETPESSSVTENAAESGEYADERPASTTPYEV